MTDFNAKLQAWENAMLNRHLDAIDEKEIEDESNSLLESFSVQRRRRGSKDAASPCSNSGAD